MKSKAWLALVGVCVMVNSTDSFAQSAPPNPDPVTWGAPAEAGTTRRSPALMITGYGLAGLGTAGVLTGVVMIAQDETQVSECFAAPCDTGSSSGGPLELFGTIAVVSGGAVTLVGLGLGIWGTMKVHGSDDRDEGDAPTVSAAPSVHVGPGAVRAAWRF